MADKKKDYEVLQRIRLDDGTLVVPASEDPDLGPDEVKTVSLTAEEAVPFLNTSAVRLVPTPRQVSAGGPADGGEGPTQTAPVSPPPPAPPVETDTAKLAETFGEDVAQILEDAGYVSAAEVRAASDEVLLGVDGIGPKTLEKIRAA